MRFTVHDPCGGGNAESCAPVILGRGTLDATTLEKFRQVIADHRKEFKVAPPGTYVSAVVLSSLGGSVAAGVALGRELRALKLDTRAVRRFTEYVRTGSDHQERVVLRDAKCLSACVYAFIGGNRRAVEDDGVLGIHQFRSPALRETAESDAQALTASLSLYVQSMGVSQSFMNLASLTSPAAITMLDKQLAAELRVDNITIPLQGWRLTALNDGTPVLTVAQVVGEAHTLYLELMSQKQEVISRVTVVYDTSAMRADRLGQFPIEDMPEISLETDQVRFDGTVRSMWTKVAKLPAGKLGFACVVTFPRDILKALQKSQTLRVSDGFGRAAADISLATNLSTDNLRSGAALLLRTP
jgi:hypothetical protein